MARRPYNGRAGYGRTTALGYGYSHQKLRARWAKVVEAGEVTCGKCGRLIRPGTPWDLSHPRDDKSLPPEPWHASCNKSYASAVTKPRRRRGNPPVASPREPPKKRPPGWRNPRTGQPWSQDWTGDGIWSDE